MSRISPLEAYQELEALEKSIGGIIEEVVQEHDDELASLNRDQLLEGRDSENRTLKKYRNPKYARQKNLQNPLPGFGTPDLLLTGVFYNSLTFDTKADKMGSTDPKARYLENRYGGNIYGLTKDNIEAYKEIVSPYIIQKIASKSKFLIVKY